QVRPAVDALQQHGIDLLEQLIDGVDDLDAEFFTEGFGIVTDAVAAGWDVLAAAGVGRDDADASEVALRLGIVEQAREGFDVRRVESDDANADRLGLLGRRGKRKQADSEEREERGA